MRHKKSCSSSSSVGLPKLKVVVPCGSKTEKTDFTAPPLPEVSMPCSTTKMDGASFPSARAFAKSSSCRSLNSSSKRFACFFKALALPSKPGVALGSESSKLKGVETRNLLASLTLNLLILPTLLNQTPSPCPFSYEWFMGRCKSSRSSRATPTLPTRQSSAPSTLPDVQTCSFYGYSRSAISDSRHTFRLCPVLLQSRCTLSCTSPLRLMAKSGPSATGST